MEIDQTHMPARKWLTVAEAADLLRVQPRTIRRMIARGELPARRLGSRSIRLRADDVEAVLLTIPNARSGRGVAS
jgi:excisionase family DNA binding protein